MSSLNPLEKAVLERIVRGAPENLVSVLREQIDGTAVVGREYGGGVLYRTRGSKRHQSDRKQQADYRRCMG